MKLRFSVKAQREITEVLLTIVSNNPHVAGAFNRDVRDAAERIKLFPHSGRLVDPSTGLRCVVLRRWRYKLYYVEDPREKALIIVTVVNTRRLSILDIISGGTDLE